MADTFIRMTHPDLEGEAVAPKAAFERVWSKNGWVLVEGSESSKANEPIQTSLSDAVIEEPGTSEPFSEDIKQSDSDSKSKKKS